MLPCHEVLTISSHLRYGVNTLYPTSETQRKMGKSFGRTDFWDRLGGQGLVMIGQWFSKQPSTNFK